MSKESEASLFRVSKEQRKNSESKRRWILSKKQATRIIAATFGIMSLAGPLRSCAPPSEIFLSDPYREGSGAEWLNENCFIRWSEHNYSTCDAIDIFSPKETGEGLWEGRDFTLFSKNFCQEGVSRWIQWYQFMRGACSKK